MRDRPGEPFTQQNPRQHAAFSRLCTSIQSRTRSPGRRFARVAGTIVNCYVWGAVWSFAAITPFLGFLKKNHGCGETCLCVCVCVWILLEAGAR